jgi:hypothetical protein
MFGLRFGGIFTSELSGAIAALVGFTGLFGGGSHYAAILVGRTKAEIERATAFGRIRGVRAVAGVPLLAGISGVATGPGLRAISVASADTLLTPGRAARQQAFPWL